MSRSARRSSRRRFLQVSAGVTLGLACTNVQGRGEGADLVSGQSTSDDSIAGTAGSSTAGQVSPRAAQTSVTQPMFSTGADRRFLWHPQPPRGADLTVAFRAHFSTVPAQSGLKLQVFGAHWFNVWINGRLTTEGPARFDAGHPEFEELELNLASGTHCIAVAVQAEGVSTRILRGDIIPPFWWCRLLDSTGNEIPLRWKCLPLEAYAASNVRINPQLAWNEWCDLKQLPRGWKQHDFDASGWAEPVAVTPKLGALRPLSINRVKSVAGRPKLLAQGYYIGPRTLHRGTAGEDIHEGLLKRDLNASREKHDGVWRRYDLGQIRLFRPRFTMDLPAGTHVDFVYAETLSRGSVLPLIPLSCGSSCNLDHYRASGGEEEFLPLAPRGGRYLEVHLNGKSEQIRFLSEEYLERTYFDEVQGAFHCDDELLNRIWALGVATLRGCTEDAVIDNPTRERGEWTGDVVTVGLDIIAAAHDDLRLIRRGLRHSAWCANSDGMIAGLAPGGTTYVSTYALQWIPAVMHYYQHTGDRDFLTEMLPYARANLAAFAKHAKVGLLGDVPGTWSFVDWGYLPIPGGPDPGLNIHYLAALQQMTRWMRELHVQIDGTIEKQLADTRGALQPLFQACTDAAALDALGFHVTALGFHVGLWAREQTALALAAMKRHILRCFPNDRTAPQLDNPTVQSRQLITPYFAHYAFPPLIENGEMDFVLEQYRTCWGYALEDGRTTMIEVFSPNWSHCHQWACCPTWQLSRYVLGLHPHYELGSGHYLLNLKPGSLAGAQGKVPMCDGEMQPIGVSWTRTGGKLSYKIETSREIVLHRTLADVGTRITGTWECDDPHV